jgi:Ca2+-transporting ATPase
MPNREATDSENQKISEQTRFVPWNSDVDSCLAVLRTSARGLTPSDVTARRAEYGPNCLAERPPRSIVKIVFDQLKGFLNGLLGVAAITAWSVGQMKDAFMIAAVVTFNTLLGFAQEFKAEKTLAALKRMIPRRAQVRRDGSVFEISAEQVVPGDIVLLDAGSRIPADARLVIAESLEVDESALTGESVPVKKSHTVVCSRNSQIADRENMLFMNTVVTRGRAEAVVTSTAALTEMGRVAEMIGSIELPPTPLQRQLDQLGKRLAFFAIVSVSIIGVIEYFRGDTLQQIAMETISLAVASIPEGLPAVVTITLALGLYRMAKKRAIVKRLAAVETLGSTSVICTDKTGTLTLNQMTAETVWVFSREFIIDKDIALSTLSKNRVVVETLALCNDVQLVEGKLSGDPTEVALVRLAQQLGVNAQRELKRRPRIAEVPFDSDHKYMATAHVYSDQAEILIKGAPDAILTRCKYYSKQDGSHASLGQSDNEAIRIEVRRMAKAGMRVLAMACRLTDLAAVRTNGGIKAEIGDLTFTGLVGLIDPPREEAREAIARCREAGIAVKMITGDHKDTASAIARQLGLGGDAVTGVELERITDRELATKIDGIGVFARVASEHKLRIVRALKASGKVVAMTGDGVNDAPALKASDIGIAMGSGTEVAKEAATMVLTDDDFSTIVKAVQEGRTIYENIVNFVRFQLSTNFGALLTIVGAPLLGLPSPLKPIQVLWVAMIMDGPPAIALGLDPANSDVMSRPPRDLKAQVLTWARLRVLVFFGVIMATGTLGLLYWRNASGSIESASTLSFTTFVLFQFFNAFNARSEGRSAFGRHLFTNFRLWSALGIVVALQILVVHWHPLQTFFGTISLTAREWAVAVAVASSLLLVEELRKLLVRCIRQKA